MILSGSEKRVTDYRSSIRPLLLREHATPRVLELERKMCGLILLIPFRVFTYKRRFVCVQELKRCHHDG